MMDFGEALHQLLSGNCYYIRREAWLPDVKIKLQVPDEHSKMTARYLYVESRNGLVPWIPNMIELSTNYDWEVI